MTSRTRFSSGFSPWVSIPTLWAALWCLGLTQKSGCTGPGGLWVVLRLCCALVTWRAFHARTRVPFLGQEPAGSVF